MKCYFCKRNEDDINEIFVPVIKKIEEKIAKLDYQIKLKKEKCANEFSQENREKVKNINANLLKIKIDAFLDNLGPFLDMDNNFQILKIYWYTYKPAINKVETLKKLVDLYILEPTDKRLHELLGQYDKDKDTLSNYVKKIKSENKLIELYASELDIPLIVFNFENELINKIFDEFSKKDEKITLCPYCSYLFRVSKEKIDKIKGEPGLPHDSEGSSLREWDFRR